tara:strand:- start:736 stop:1287 length:552 start_codon:yes stop_codon:yes gene_type:complete
LKTKLKQFQQHLYHEIEDDEKAEAYLDEALSMIGLVVMYFNSLESSLDSVLCENFTDRTDAPGLIVLNKLNFGSKVELFKRFCDDFHLCMPMKIDEYNRLITDLNEASRLRNLVVHANWESTDEEGYTFVRLKMSKNGMHQEYRQFSPKSFEKMLELFIQTQLALHKYWENRNDVLYQRTPST